jgi:hypothetical protein
VARALAAATYWLATVAWAAVMGLSSLMGCEGGCFGDTRHRLNVSLVLGLVGLAIASAAMLGSILRRWIGLSFLGLHVLVFAINLGIFWGLGATPWIFIPPATLAALAGYLGLPGLHATSPKDLCP